MIPEAIKIASRDLRKNMTEAEVIIWNILKWKKLGFKFSRQNSLYLFTEESWLKRYIIPDFYCKEKWLILEVDGNIHNDEDIYIQDKSKEILLKQKWLNLLRIKNQDIFHNLSDVILTIKIKLH